MNERRDERGVAMVAALMVVMILTGLSATFFFSNASRTIMTRHNRSEIELTYLAEAGAAAALAELRSGVDVDGDGLGTVQGALAGEAYSVVATDLGNGQMQLLATGTIGARQKQVEVVATGGSGGIFWNAIFAGNALGDPNYDMPFGGTGVQGDDVNGDVYSGKNLSVAGDASVDGSVMTAGSATGIEYTQGTQPIPDITAMGYETNNDVDVAAVFATQGVYQADDAGGSAYQVPQSELAHIFRMNPSDRGSETNSTIKNDYFLEDPYEPVQVDPNQNGSDAYHIGLNQDADPTKDGNQKIYFVDGNLWIHNKKTYSFKFKHSEEDGVQATFVVKGNVYISDNVFLNNINKDGVLFIAMRDLDVEDSGNVYIGDPTFGTVKKMETFLYAENDFVDNNLDEAGSAEFEIHGLMSGGNQVDINRDYYVPPTWKWVKKKGKWVKEQVPGYWTHQKMTVTLDPRVKEGNLELPGLPTASGGSSDWNVVSWRTLGTTSTGNAY